MHTFFENETIDPAYFESNRSLTLLGHYTLINKINRALNDSQQLLIIRSELTSHLHRRLAKNIKRYEAYCDEIIRLIRLRGFKDHGAEGRMRKYVHELEKFDQELNLIDILQLRRHEKDFFLRQESNYLFKHKGLIAAVKSKLHLNNKVGGIKKKEILALLDNYSSEFNKIVLLDQKIGIKNRSGLKRHIDIKVNTIAKNYKAIINEIELFEKSELKRLYILFCFCCFISIIIFIVLAFVISKKASLKLTDLSKKIEGFVDSNFTVPTILPYNKDSNNEIEKLSNNCAVMELQIINQLKELKDLNDEMQLLLYRSSHDIRNPLCSIKGLTALGRDLKSYDHNEYYDMIDRSCDNLLRIVDDLRVATDIKVYTPSTEMIDFKELFENLFMEHRRMNLKNDIVFSTEMAIQGEFYSAISLIKTIFRCLIQNAVNNKDEKKKGSFVRVKIHTMPNELIKISVEDNGSGIKSDNKEKIFNIFHKTTDVHGDTGLGFYIVKNALKKLNGGIYFESTEGKGSLFTIILPNMKQKKKSSRSVELRQLPAIKSKLEEFSLNFI